jgi:hypothetical protein
MRLIATGAPGTAPGTLIVDPERTEPVDPTAPRMGPTAYRRGGVDVEKLAALLGNGR